ncbi:MAG: DnaJ domain-containing protein [Nitrospirota bacterium]|nr:MAG: DnaJ domain-containing protein [Nitrospirota bacterium]
MGKDKRFFKRYRRRMSCNISFDGSSMDVETVDYSINGIGAVLNSGVQFPEELTVKITMFGHEVKMYGRVAWKKHTPSGLRVGIELAGPIQGTLETYRLSDLLIGLQRTRKDGTLEIKFGNVTKKIYIKNGDIIFSSSDDEKDELGHILLRGGAITREQYDNSRAIMAAEGKQEGAVLVDAGYLKPRDLFNALKIQTEKIILDLFSIESGAFYFHEDVLPEEEVIKLNFSAANLIYKGIKGIKDADLIQGFFPSFKKVFRLSPDPLDLFQDIQLNADDRGVLAYVNGENTIDHILSLSALRKIDTLKILHMLLCANIVVDLSEIDPDDFVDDIDLVSEVIEEARDDVGKQTVDVPEEFVSRVNAIYGRLGDIGYYEVFGLDEKASISDIKKAYYSMAKDYHPDKHFYLEEGLKDKLSLIFSFITSAYSTISDPRKRNEYDESLDGGPDIHASGTDTAKIKFAQGEKELKKGNYEYAAELFGQASYLDKSESKHFFYYGVALYRMGKLKEAEREIRNALKIHPASSDYLAEIGHIYLDMGFAIRAKKNFERALQSRPSHKRAKEGMSKLSKDVQ